MNFNLRPYQQRTVEQARLGLARKIRRITIYLPTGGGKTLIAVSIIGKAVAKGRKVVFLANRKQLVAQTSAILYRYGIAHGILQAENTCRIHAQVLVASIDTVHARGLPDDVGLLIIDECHSVAGSSKYRRLLTKYNNVPVIGLTATPFAVGMAKHDAGIGGPVFEELIVGATISDLIATGHLVDCEIYAPSEPDLAKVRSWKGADGLIDYAESDLTEATDRPELIGDILKHWQRLAAGKQTVVFACSIPHSKHIVEQFVGAGVSAEHIDYHHSDDERAAILNRFARGETMVLSNVALLSEGWDCPTTEVMILARPTRSLIRFIQMVGRALRPAPGKAIALLLDHSGSTARLGHPCDDLPLELDDGNPKVPGNQQPERKESLPKPCPSCHFMRPTGVHRCPKCGFAPERQDTITVGDGELVKAERKPLKKEASQHIYSQLLGYAEQRGFKPGWAFHKFKECTGKEARGLRQIAAKPSLAILNWIKSRQIAAAKGREKGRNREGH